MDQAGFPHSRRVWSAAGGAFLTAPSIVIMMILTMRTTVTLDDDTERMIRDDMRRTQRSFKVTLNEAIRNGLK